MENRYLACAGAAIVVVLACVSSLVIVLAMSATVPDGQMVGRVNSPAPSSTEISVTATPLPQPTPVSTTKPTAAPPAPSSPAKLVGAGLGTEAMLRQIEVPIRDRLDLALRLGLSDHPIPAVVHPAPVPYQLGDKQTFWVSESNALQHYERVAALRYVGEHSYWWVEDTYSVPDAAILSSAQAFEDKIYPTNRAFFGEEWSPGVDNDPRIHIFIGNVPGVGGYFYSVNEYSSQINPYSNEKEMFYINVNAARPGTDYLDSILAHEYQHMIHWHNDTNEETWVNEGLSELAMDLNGYDTGGVIFSFFQSPDTQLNTWGDTPNESIAHYGSSYLFMRYFVDRFGENVMRQVVAHPDNGILGFDAVLGQLDTPHTFDDVFADFLLSNYLDTFQPAASEWGYPTMTVGPMKLDAEHNTYPLERQSLVSQYAADYIEFTGSGDLTIAFTGTTQVKIAPNDAHSGGYQWWSNRGDDSDMTLTRSFDLTGVDEARLQFWAWYDIEKDWDFAFVEVSVDGGQTWTILPGLYTTTENRSGNSFGHAWTGTSGDAQTPQWVLEDVDLSPYVGQVVDVRFEYITDDAVSHVGLLLDDISIASVGYADDAESGDAGWLAEGFARIDNALPQRYCVQVLALGEDAVEINKMEIGPENQGQITISGLGTEVSRVIMVVSGMTPFTTEPAPYTYSAQVSTP